MIYCETLNAECIAVHPLDDIDSTQYVELVKYGDEPKLAVWIGDNDEWTWEFDLTCPSDYERIKLTVFDAVFVCDTMFELADALDSVFKNEYPDILIEDECDCCGCCGGCKYTH